MKAFNVFEVSSRWAKEQKLPYVSKQETSSTQDLARMDFSLEKDSFKLYLTDFQTKGRGRCDRSWLNLEKGEALLSTWCFKTSFFAFPTLSVVIGAILRHSLLKVFPNLGLSIKLPNDLYQENQKIGGILVETEKRKDSVILMIGLGMNVFSAPNSVKHASFLSKNVNLSVERWNHFLDEFYCLLQKVILIKNPYENKFFKNISLEAIESFPLKKQRIKENI